jgi:hypothetical protein
VLSTFPSSFHVLSTPYNSPSCQRRSPSAPVTKVCERLSGLGWQTWSEKALLQGGEIGLGIATEAELTSPALVAVVQSVTQCLPSRNIGGPQVSSREGKASTGSRGHHTHRATHNQSRRGSLVPSDAPLDMAGRPKIVLESGLTEHYHITSLFATQPCS